MKKDLVLIVILLILSFWSFRPFLVQGFFPMHDDTQVGRVVEMGRALREGQFPVRWVNDLGYGFGYPLFNFYGPLPYYVGGFFYAIGFDGLSSTKIMFVLGIILAGVSLYFLASGAFGRIGGLIAGLFFVYAPYHAVDIYVRGAVGEFWALVFLPLIIRGALRYRLSRPLAALTGGIGLAGVVLSHTILGYVTVVFYFAAMVFLSIIQLLTKKTDSQTLIRLMLILALGLGISAFFWLPAVLEMQFTNVAAQIGAGADFRDHFVCFNQLWDSAWGFGGSSPGCTDGFSFKLGKMHVAFALLALLIYFWRDRPTGKNVSTIFLSLTISAVAVFMMLPVSRPIWEFIPGFAYIQYPWRFLAFSIFGLSLVSGSIFFWIKPPLIKVLLAGVTVACLLFFNSKLFVPQYTYAKAAPDFESDRELKWRVSKISDEYLPHDFIRPNNFNEVPNGVLSSNDNMSVEPVVDNGIYARFIIKAKRESDMIIRRVYFPGWLYTLDGQKIKPSIQNGLPHISMPESAHTFEISFSDTPVRTLGNLISLLTGVFIFIYYGKKTYA